MRHLLLLILSISILIANQQTIKIGTLAKRGAEATLRKWNPTAAYLSAQLPQYKFEIVPIKFDDVFTTVEKGEVDFILANPGFYVILEHKYGAQRIATLVNKHISGLVQKEFGGVIFTHIDNKDSFNSLESIKGSKLGAVNEKSLGGWQMAWRELVEKDIDIDSDFDSINFEGTHDNVVYAILRKEIDVGTVRTDTLERMALEGKIDLENFHIINAQHYDGFPFMISTKLYPEWPFAKTKRTSDKLSKEVAVALMNMPSDSKAAKIASIEGWNTPLSYQPVHTAFQTLEIPPYYQPIEFWDVILKYWGWILFYLFGAVVGIGIIIYQIRLTNFLKDTQEELVQTEKMASLGRLVAGIAHEVNTPIGIGITAASYLKNEIKKFHAAFKDQSLTQTAFEEFIDSATQSSNILMNNLERSAELIRSFKQVSVDQSSDEVRSFLFKEYLESIILNLKPTLKNHNHIIEVQCSDTLMIESIPGAFYQIFTNFIMNSILHGFEDKELGHILIEVKSKGDEFDIIYKDDGKGMSKSDLKKIFDPFFTTKRSSGGSGLGTHIVYNLVTQKLHGTISAESQEGEGLTLIMHFKGIKHV